MNIAVSTASFWPSFSQGRINIHTFPEYCAQSGLNAIELNDFVMPPDKPLLRKLKQKVAQLGLDISAIAIENNYYRKDVTEIEKEKQHIQEYLEVAFFLGAPILRVDTSPFSKDLPESIRPPGITDQMVFNWAVATFKELIPLAEDKGITFALENHGGITKTSSHLLKVVQAVDSPWFKINIDTGNFYADPATGLDPFEDPYQAIQKLLPHTVYCHAKVWNITPDLKETTLDYDRIFALFRKHNYQGTISIEYMGPADPMQMVPKCVQMFRKYDYIRGGQNTMKLGIGS